MFQFSDLVFSQEQHSYTCNGVELVPVTIVIGSVKPVFDADTISKKSAAKLGISQDELLAEWNRKGDEGRDRGSRVHTYVEDRLNGVNDPILLAVNGKLPEMVAFDDAWKSMQEKLCVTVAGVELVIGDPTLGIAGMVDCLLDVGAEQKRSIFDWKTGKYEINSPWGKMLPPFEDLPDCQHSHYSLQTSVYRHVYEKYMGMELGDSYLLHLRSDGSHCLHRGLDLRDRILPWFDGRLACDICGDPSANRQAQTVISTIDDLVPLASKLKSSIRTDLMRSIKDLIPHLK